MLATSLAVGEFVPIARNSGLNLWIGNNPRADGFYVYPPHAYLDAQNDALAREAAMAWIREHPMRALQLVPAKLWYLMRWEEWQTWIFASTTASPVLPFERIISWTTNSYYWMVLGAAGVGSRSLMTRHQPRLLILWMLFAYNLCSYLPFFGLGRFRWPLQFILILYAGVGMVALIRWIQRATIGSSQHTR